MNAKEIVSTINHDISQTGARYYNQFYVGITDNEARFKKMHNVNDEKWSKSYLAANLGEAQTVKTFYINQGMRGTKNSSHTDSKGQVYVYCYLITNSTYE